MQELVYKLETLKRKDNLKEQEILKIASLEELFFIVSDAKMLEEPNYRNLYDLFPLLRERMFEMGGMNIFEEYLTLKMVYLREAYGVNSIILEALIVLLGAVYLDYRLEKEIFNEDDFYKFFIKRYEEYKHNNELSILKMFNNFDPESFKLDTTELQGVVEELKKLASDEPLVK